MHSQSFRTLASRFDSLHSNQIDGNAAGPLHGPHSLPGVRGGGGFPARGWGWRVGTIPFSIQHPKSTFHKQTSSWFYV